MEILKGFVFDLQKFADLSLTDILALAKYIDSSGNEQNIDDQNNGLTKGEHKVYLVNSNLVISDDSNQQGDQVATVTTEAAGTLAATDAFNVTTFASVKDAGKVVIGTVTGAVTTGDTQVLALTADGATFKGATALTASSGVLATATAANGISVESGTLSTKAAVAYSFGENGTAVNFPIGTDLSNQVTVNLANEQTVKVKDVNSTTYEISVGKDGACTAPGTTTEFEFNKGEGTVNTVKYVDDSAADGYTVTSTATSSYLSDGTVALDGTKDNRAVTVKIEDEEKTVSLSAGTAVVDKDGKVTEATAGSNITTAVAADDSVKTAEKFAAGDKITVNKVEYVAGKTAADTTAMPLTITTTATSSSLYNGTVYLDKTGDVSVGTDSVAYKNGDISVTVTNGKISAVHDLDNGDSFTLTTTSGTKTYEVVDGYLTLDGKKVDTNNYLTTNEKSLVVSISDGNVTVGTPEPNVYPESKGKDLPTYADATIKVAKGTGDLHTVSTIYESGTTYVYADGTTGTSDKNAIGKITYNSSKAAYIYESKTTESQIDVSGDEKNKWIITGGSGNDTITGNALESTLNGGAGNDSIVAGQGNLAKGDAGDDIMTTTATENVTLDGGAGADKLSATGTNAQVTLTGGAGADTFVLSDTGAGYGFISDYKLSEDFVSSAKTKAEIQAAAKTAVKADGSFTDGTGTVTLKASDGYYAVNVKASDGKQIVGWTGEKAAKIDASSLKEDIMLVGTTNSEADPLFGGSGNDTIYAGAGDVVYGAAGKNLIVLDATASDDVTNTVGVGKGKDTIQGFVAGFDSETADKLTIVGGLSSLNSTLAGGTLDIKSGDAAVHMTGATTFGDTVQLLVSGKKAVFAADGATVAVSSASYADYYLGTKGTNGGSVINASAIESDVKIDLSDTNVFKNFNQVTGGQGKTSLIGGSAAETLIAGEGMTSLYGGAGKDSLVGNSAARDTFFMMAGAGNDSVSGFTYFNGENADTADVVNLSAVQSAKLVSGGVQINVNDNDKVLIENAGADDAIGYQVGGSIAAAKLGSVGGSNTFTYLKGVNYYGGGNQADVLQFASGDSDNHEVWLDGSKGITYNSIDNLDGSNAAGDLILAGDSAKNSIVGGAGTNSLWGGAGNFADTLTGGSSKNTFFYGLAEGNDVIDCGSDNDLVNLYNIGLSDVSKAEITSSAVNLEFIDGSKLTVNTGYRDVKFALKDGSTYTADHTNNSWK